MSGADTEGTSLGLGEDLLEMDMTNTTVASEAAVALAGELAGVMTSGWGWAMDVWPNLCAGMSLLSAVYIVGSNWLDKGGEEPSLLETVFSMAAASTGLASLLMLSSLRIISADAFEADPTQDSGWFCQAQGAGVAYFQLTTCFFLTAASLSVYRFVCLRQKGTTIKLTIAEQHAQVEAEQQALDEGLVPPSPPKEVSVLKFYLYVCLGVPAVLVVGMLAGQEPSPTFSFQQMHDTGWCTINMDAPMRSFTLFYVPLIICMFYTAGAYYFCFTEVKIKKGLLGKIDNEIMYDASAALVKKKTAAEFDRARRASSVVRLSLLATSACWTPQCLFGVLLVASSYGVVGGDPESLAWLSKIRSFSAVMTPMFGMALFVVIETCFNFRLRYSQAFHQKLRRLRYKVCGKKKKKKGGHADKLESDRDDDDDDNPITQAAKVVYNAFWSIVELAAFAPWALVVWVPMDTFRSEVKSNKKLAYISVMYLVFIALPSAVMFVVLPNFYQVVDATLLSDDVTEGDPKEKFAKGVAVLYVVYLCVVAFLAWLHIGHKNLKSFADVGRPAFFYIIVALIPIAGMVFAFDIAWQFIENTDKNAEDASSIKHNISIIFVYGYITSMFLVVAGTLYISRDNVELNFIENPVSHAGLNTQNLRKLISQMLENIQLTSLLLSHSAFSSDAADLLEDDPDDVPFFNDTMPAYNDTEFLSSAADVASAAADQAAAKASAAFDAMQADDFKVDFAVMKVFLFDLSYFKALFASIGDMAFDIKLALSIAAICVWVVIVMVPIVLDTITLVQSNIFLKAYAKLAFVQEFLAGPLFLIILQTFLSTVDCAKGEEGKMVLELKPSQACWETTHLLYASAGLTGLMAFVPLACLTMVEHENEAMHFRYTPLYHRVEVIAKAIMALTTQFSNTMSPMYSFPLLMCMSAWMILANKAMMPCCIIWANRLKTLGFLAQFWTGVSGIIAYYWWEPEILKLGGVPLTPVSLMMVGWFFITIQQFKLMKADRLMLLKPKKEKHTDGPAKAWSDYFGESTTSRDKVQINKLNSLRLAKRPDDTKIHYNTHHEILTMTYILRAEASAATKQRALQILSAATGSTSAEAHASMSAASYGTKQVKSTNDGKTQVDDDGTEAEEEEQLSISVQSRRRLLGFQGDEHDEDDEDYHFPEVVLVSPRSIITLLAEEFHLTHERDQSADIKFSQMWKVQAEEAGGDEDTSNETPEEKENRKKKKDMTPEEREAEKAAKEAEKAAKKEQKEADKRTKKEQKALAKAGLLEEDDGLTDVPLKTAEILFLLKRAKALISPEVVAAFGEELPKQFVVNTMLSYIRHHPPDVLRLQVSGAGTTTMGVDKTGRPEFHDDHMLEHILELPEDRIYHGTDESEEESLRKIRMIRRMYSSSHVHKLLEGINTLPDETLHRQDDAFNYKLDGAAEGFKEMSEADKQHHELLKRIHRLEQEKKIIDNEIQMEKDKALSNVSKVYLIRILAVYAEDKTFASRIMEEIGSQTLIDYLMHGDVELQAAATVCIYQLARFDPDCLDTLEHTPGGMVFVATKLTHPETHSIVMHRIAADLLVELAKRFELRRSMVASGLIGPLLLLVDTYAQLMMPGDNPAGEKLRKKIEDSVVTFTPRHEEVDSDGKLVKKSGSAGKAFTKNDRVLMDTNEIEPWCPFALKGVVPHSTHVLLSVLRVFQQLSDEDKFRSEFVGRHKGLAWVRDHCYTIQTDDAKIMAMRLLLGVVCPPFGFWDILQDAKMFGFYIEMMKFKEDKSEWQVELEPILKPDEWTTVDPQAQDALRAAREAGTKSLTIEMRGQDFTVDMTKFTRTLPSTGRMQRMRIAPMIMHSRDMVLRMRMHRVAQFLDLNHTNGTKTSVHGHKMRLVIIEKMSFEQMQAHNMAHDANLLEVVRERVLEECFDCVAEASMSTHESVRIAGVSVLTSVCTTVMHLEEHIFDRVFEHMHKIRERCIAEHDLVMYESVVVSMVAMCRNHRKGQVVDMLHTAAEVFEQLWMYKHLLGKDLDAVVKTPFWRRVEEVLTPEVLKIVTNAPNTSVHHAKAYEEFIKQPQIEAFFEAKAVKRRDAKRALEVESPEGHYIVELKHTTRDKIERGVRKAIEFSRKLSAANKKSKKARKKERKAEKQYNALLSRQIADKEEATAEHDDVIKFLDNQLDATLDEEEEKLSKVGDGSKAASETDVTDLPGLAQDVKFSNPLADDEERGESGESPNATAAAAVVVTQVAADESAAANEFEEKRKAAQLAKKEKQAADKAAKAEKKKADAEARKAAKQAKKAADKAAKQQKQTATEPEPEPEPVDAAPQDKGDATAAAAVAAAVMGASAGADVLLGTGVADDGFAEESEDEEDSLEFKGTLPPFLRLTVAQTDSATDDFKAQFEGSYQQGELFDGWPHYEHSTKGKQMHLSVIRGTGTERWFLCSDGERLTDKHAHEAYLVTPKGQLPFGGKFDWRVNKTSTKELSITLEACQTKAQAEAPPDAVDPTS